MDIVKDIYEKLYSETMSREGSLKRFVHINSIEDIVEYIKTPQTKEDYYMSHYNYITDVHKYRGENGKKFPPIHFDRIILDFDITSEELLKSEGYNSEDIYNKGKEILKSKGKSSLNKKKCVKEGTDFLINEVEDKEKEEIKNLTKDVSNPNERDSIVRDYYYKKYTSSNYLKKPYDEALKVSKFIKDTWNIEPQLFFSGGKGVHLYILFNEVDIPNPDEVIKNFGLKLEEQLNITTLDPSVIKSPSTRVIKIPCSPHFKTKLYAMPFNMETSYFEMLDLAYESEPKVPLNVDNNTELFETFLKNYSTHLLTISKEDNTSNNKNIERDTNKNYTLNGDLFDLQEPFSRVYQKGHRNIIGHRLIHLFYRSDVPKEDCEKFFETLGVGTGLDNNVQSWINRVYDTPNDEMFIGNMGYFIQGVKECSNPEDTQYIINKFKSYFEGEDKTKTINVYEPPKDYHKELQDNDYKWDKEGFYCPIHEQGEKSYTSPLSVKGYFRIKRGSLFEVCIGNFNPEGEFEPITQSYSSKKPFNVFDKNRNSNLGKWSNEVGFGYIKQDFTPISLTLGKIKEFPQLTEEFNNYKPPKQEDLDSDIPTPEEIIDSRRHPQLTTEEKKIAIKVREQIEDKGFEQYMKDILKDVYMGDLRNIMRKVLLVLTIMRGKGSSLSETEADSGSGKSEEDKIVLDYITPPRYIMDYDDLTSAHFERFSEKHTEFLDRTIFDLGDLGEEEVFKQVKKIFNIFKRLITEGKYKRGLTEENNKGGSKTHNQKDLYLRTSGFGVFYQTVTNSFTKGDPQLESRTLKSTITYDSDVEDSILDFVFDNYYDNSPEAIKKRKAIENLKNLGIFLLSLVDKTIVIVNPYKETFKEYSKTSEVAVRELTQQLNLFNSYCLITLNKCDVINGVYVASKEQLEEYMNKINLENALIPYENEFLKMLVGKNRKNNQLTMIEVTSEEESEEESKLDPLNPYYNNALEQIKLYRRSDEEEDYNQSHLETYVDIDNLNSTEEQSFKKKLMTLYRLGGRSSDHEENVFFTIQDIENIFKSYKPFKNIKDLSTLLLTLTARGYLGKLPFNDPHKNRYNIYYLTSKCQELDKNFDVKNIDEDKVNERLKHYGVIE